MATARRVSNSYISTNNDFDVAKKSISDLDYQYVIPCADDGTALNSTGSAHSSINNGTKTVAASGTAETLVAATTPCKKVDIMALDTNTGKVWIGGSSIDKTAKNGKYIFAAQSYTIEIDDLVKIYLDVDTNGEGVVFTYYS